MYFVKRGVSWASCETWDGLVSMVSKGLHLEVMEGEPLPPEKKQQLEIEAASQAVSVSDARRLHAEAYALLFKVRQYTVARETLREASVDSGKLDTLLREAEGAFARALSDLRRYEPPGSQWAGLSEEEWQRMWCDNPNAFWR
jgi:hypothetical protein